MSLMRSTATGVVLLSTGRRCCPSPGPDSISGSGFASGVPLLCGRVGSHSTYCSPISD